MLKSNNKTKKEVSCKTLLPVFNAAQEKKINLNRLIEGVPYDLSYLKSKHERIEWHYWHKIILNSSNYFASQEYENMGRDYVKNGSYIEGVLAAFIFFSSKKFPKPLREYFFRMAENDFTCIDHKTEYPAENKIRVTAQLKKGYEFCQQFFLISKGVWDQFGIIVGHKEFRIYITWVDRGAIFEVTWKKEGPFFNIRRKIRWLFQIHKAFLDLTDSHTELLNQYSKLDESKKLLQKQTTRLKTAYNISRSIRKSLHIENTLKAITSALVTDAGFSYAGIFLFRDTEGNSLNIEVSEGIRLHQITPMHYPLMINDEDVGELTIYSKTGIAPFDTEDLLDYLLPVITISIHDSLVLRAVTDYKNNLELKVEERTAELSKMQKKLSHTIDLLKDAQLAQNRFFTNISHEFRTPLTLIMGPSRQIMEMTDNDRIIENAKLINRSAKKLNRLAGQLLDISRIEAGHMKLKVSPQNIVPVICDIVSSFQSFAERKKIVLRFQPESDEIMLYIDKDKVDKIISNLLSNAIKFTPENGSVRVEVKRSFPENEFVEISVSDTGIGIPKEQLDKIFNRFYQVDNRISKQFEGTGVGLSLTRELAELHKGKIIVESEEGKGSVFRLLLPFSKKHFSSDELSINKVEGTQTPKTEFPLSSRLINPVMNNKNNGDEILQEDNKPLVLIIEDNSELRYYIKDVLGSLYNIIEASDGKEGLKKSAEQMPDLIISDIMMPGVDGMELCNRLKSDPETSHIPLIFLTAKTTLKDKIEGLETGADDYITKPFEAEELNVRIKNLLDQKARLHEYFRKHGLFEIDEKQVTPIDRQFLQKSMEIINEHISDSSFSREALAETLAISRSLLNKKLTTLIGEPPGELIRRIRLNRAADMIKNNSGNFTEIAFEVGFKDSSYFSVCFKKQFGMSPSDYLRSTIKG